MTVASPIKDDSGNVVGFIGVASDITNLVNAENESVVLKRQLEKQNDTLRNFAYTVGHNLNTHKRSINFIYDMLKSSEIAIQAHEYFALFDKAVKSLNKTVDDLNELVKSQTLNVDLEHTKIDLLKK